MLQLNLDIKEENNIAMYESGDLELYTENKCYILYLRNVRATKIGTNSESKEI
jgi:hypothetical protein